MSNIWIQNTCGNLVEIGSGNSIVVARDGRESVVVLQRDREHHRLYAGPHTGHFLAGMAHLLGAQPAEEVVVIGQGYRES